MTRLRSDVTLAVVVGVVVAAVFLAEGATWAEAVGGVMLCAPLAWRRRSPLGVLGLVACGVPVYLALADPSPALVPPVLVALYTVAAHGSRRRTVAVAAGLAPYVIAIVVLFSPEEGSDLRQILQFMSQFGFALAVGEAVRSQRAFIAAIRERAERAERERELEARRRVGEERVRIARDVHDVVAHSIATISTQASVGVHVGRDEPARAVEVLESIKAVSAQALHDLRHALGVLRDESGDGPTDPTPSVHDVPGLVQRARDSGLSVVLRMEGSSAALPTALQVAIYRIVQEGLTNVMRHASGAQATVRVAVGGHRVEVDVTDDGGGAPTASSDSGSGSGLVGMRQRASAMGGELEAGREADGGFRVRAVLPLDREPA
jgi:signal transduction histidine kinase